jgi:hypothetical protein
MLHAGHRLLSVVVALVSFHRNGVFVVFQIQHFGAIVKLQNNIICVVRAILPESLCGFS